MILKYKGINVSFESKGKGSTIVLLHGFLENKTMWNPFVNQLSKKNRVVSIDLLGHGESGCLGYIHTMEDMAEAVKAVLSSLRLSRVILIGHSMGGYVSLAFAENYPEMIKGLCLMNSTSQSDSEERKHNRDRAIQAVKQNYKSFVRISITNLFRPKNRTIYSEELKKVKKEALKTPLQGIVSALEGMKIRKDRTQLFRNGNFKKLLILGRHDPVLDYKSTVEIAENSDIEVAELPDGHMSQIENKKEISDILMHFIEKNSI